MRTIRLELDGFSSREEVHEHARRVELALGVEFLEVESTCEPITTTELGAQWSTIAPGWYGGTYVLQRKKT